MSYVEKTFEETIYAVETRDFVLAIRAWTDYNSGFSEVEILNIQDLSGKDVELDEEIEDILLNEAIEAIEEQDK